MNGNGAQAPTWSPGYHYRVERRLLDGTWEPIDELRITTSAPLDDEGAGALYREAQQKFPGCKFKLVGEVTGQDVRRLGPPPPPEPDPRVGGREPDYQAMVATLMQLKERAEQMVQDLITTRHMTGNWIQLGAPIDALKGSASHFLGAASALSQWQRLCAEHKRWKGGVGS